MDFKRFRTFVQGSLRKGFNAGPVFLKSSQKSLTPRETSVSEEKLSRPPTPPSQSKIVAQTTVDGLADMFSGLQVNMQ